MNKSESLYTVYELYRENGAEFPFWIKGSSSAQTCLMVVGWSKFISAKAYQGIPKLIFKWLAHTKPRYEFTFFDNRVPKGQFPLTSAIGNQKGMQVFDPMVLVNIERYQKINIRAQCLEQVYPDEGRMSIANNMGFFNQCLIRFPNVSFSISQGEEPYLIVRQKAYTITNQHQFDQQLGDPQLKLVLEQVLASRIGRH